MYDSGISSILEDVRESAEGSLILSFFMDDSADIHQLTEDMEIFKDKDVKIIRSMLQSNHHGKMVCAAYRAGLMTSGRILGTVLKFCGRQQKIDLPGSKNLLEMLWNAQNIRKF